MAEGLWSLMGINVDEDGSLCGDVDFDQVKTKAGVLTPVPGGRGKLLPQVLLKHLIRSAKEKIDKPWGTCKTFLDAFGRNRHWYRRWFYLGENRIAGSSVYCGPLCHCAELSLLSIRVK